MNYSLPDADLRPPRVHTVGLTITIGAFLAVLGTISIIGSADAPDRPAEIIKAARQTEESQAAQPSISPSPSTSTLPSNLNR